MEQEKVNDEAALIDDYLSVVTEIRKRKNKKISADDRKGYLKRLLTPLLRLSSPYFKRDSTYDFINEDIRIDKEINIDQLIYDKIKYSIEPDPLNNKSFHPDRSRICIYDDLEKYRVERDKKEKARLAHIEQLERAGTKVSGSLRCPPPALVDGGTTSIRELYKKWLPSLTREVITSKDLLDQILVCFTIKRALNGDKSAIDKLYSLYEAKALKTARGMARARRLSAHIKDIDKEGKILLRQIIAGFGPQEIINSLLTGRPVSLWIEKLYFWCFSEYIPRQINKIMKRSPCTPFLFPKEQTGYKELNRRLKSRSRETNLPMSILNLPSGVLSGMALRYYLDPYSPIRHDTFFKSMSGNRLVRKFNSYSFRPKKETNLTMWLFGNNKTRGGFMSGKFCQLIDETFKKYENASGRKYDGGKGYQCPKCKIGFTIGKIQKEIECPSCYHSFHVGEIDKSNLSLCEAVPCTVKKTQKNKRARPVVDQQDFKDAIMSLINKGSLSPRNADIFKKNKLEKISQQTLAHEYRLHRVQINRICKEVKTQLQNSLKH